MASASILLVCVAVASSVGLVFYDRREKVADPIRLLSIHFQIEIIGIFQVWTSETLTRVGRGVFRAMGLGVVTPLGATRSQSETIQKDKV